MTPEYRLKPALLFAALVVVLGLAGCFTTATPPPPSPKPPPVPTDIPLTPTDSPTPTDTATPTITPTPTNTLPPSVTPTFTPSRTPRTPIPTNTPTPAPTRYRSPTPVRTNTPTLTLTPSLTPTPTNTAYPGTVKPLLNGSFEEDDDGDDIPDHWKGKKLGGKDKRYCKDAYEGKCSFRIRGDDTLKILQQTRSFDGLAGDIILFQVWGKSDGVPTSDEGVAQLIIYYTDGKTKTESLDFDPAAPNWVKERVVLIADKAYDELRVRLIYDGASGDMLFDHVRLEIDTLIR